MTTENVLDKSSLRERVARDGRVKVMSFDYCGAR